MTKRRAGPGVREGAGPARRLWFTRRVENTVMGCGRAGLPILTRLMRFSGPVNTPGAKTTCCPAARARNRGRISAHKVG
jgi:hypothetical protein